MIDNEASATSSEQLQYDLRVVAFLDILGFRALVSAEPADALRTINIINDALEHTLKYIEEQHQAGWVSIKTFSDCLCLSTDEDYLPSLIDAVAFIQLWLSFHDIFVRGGISLGYHCETPRIIFSKGLVDAYQLQEQDPFPRVVLASKVVEKMLPTEFVATWGNCVGPATGPLADFILIDGNGVPFLDYLNLISLLHGVAGDGEEMFRDHAKPVREQLRLHSTEPSIYRKYLWLSHYHNASVRVTFPPDADEWFDDEYQQLMDALLITPPPGSAAETDAEVVRFRRPATDKT